MRPTTRSALRIALLTTLLLVGHAPPAAEIRDGDLVLFASLHNAPTGRLPGFGEMPASLLNDSVDGRQVAVLALPAGWRHRLPVQAGHALELLVLDGQLDWDGTRLATLGYAHRPAAGPAVRLQAGAGGARVLVFRDPAREAVRAAPPRALAADQLPWRPGVVARQDTGQALALEVKDLLWVEETGQRTWLLRAGPDLSVPWETHTGVEEGFLISGDYRIGECLADGEVTGDYGPGGYFYRPGGIVHSGPQSGSRNGAMWLLRTPTRLTVDFVAGCPPGGDDRRSVR